MFIFFPGFSGSLCEFENENSSCINKPCQSGGKCVLVNSLYEYVCHCPRGRMGKLHIYIDIKQGKNQFLKF